MTLLQSRSPEPYVVPAGQAFVKSSIRLSELHHARDNEQISTLADPNQTLPGSDENTEDILTVQISATHLLSTGELSLLVYS